MAIPLKYSIRNLWVRRSTTLATAAGIGLVVFVLASSLMLAAGVRSTLVSTGSRDKALVLSRDAQIEDASRLPHSALALVAAAPGVRRSAEGASLVSGESLVQLPFKEKDGQARTAGVQIRGVTEAAFALRPELRVTAGRRPKSGTHEAIIGERLRGRYEGLTLGGAFEINKEISFTIVGVFEASGSAYESEVWTDLDSLRNALGWEGYITSVTAQLESPEALDAFAAALQGDKRQGLTVERERAYYERVSRNLSSAIIGLGALVSAIFALAAMLGAMITMYGAVGQRTREIGALRAIGFSPRQVLFLFVLESSALAFLGAAAGVLLALLTPLLDFSTTNAATGQALVFRFLPDPSILFGAAATGTLVGALGGLFPAVKAARMSPIHAMRA